MQPQTKHAWVKLLRTLGLLILFSFLLTWLLEFRYFGNEFVTTWDFVISRPRVFLFNSWLMLIMLTFLSSLAGSIFRGTSIGTILVLIIGYVQSNKFASRGAPLLPEDFQLASEAGALSKFVSVESLVRLGLCILVTIVAFELLHHFAGHYFIGSRSRRHSSETFARRHLIIPRLVTALACLGLFLLCTDFIRNHSGEQFEEVPLLGTNFTAWNQNINYRDNGFIVGFLYNCSGLRLTAPDGYSEERLVALKSELSTRAAADPNPSLSDQDYNIVVILDESFIDPAAIESLYPHAGGDITPVLHRIMASYPSGYTYSIDYGGGTANVEFEAISGLTNFWINTVPYTNLLPYREKSPSLASFAKSNGYLTSAIHAYSGSMYKRNIVLEREGFDKFTTVYEFTHQERDGKSDYVNDRSTYQEILDALAGEQTKQFILGITMQNHQPYLTGTYDELHFSLSNRLESSSSGAIIETYFESLHNSDRYLGEFLSALDAMDEKTVVLFFGDHAPGIFPELAGSSDPDTFALSRRTPYFIYANFELPNVSLPTTTPNCLTNTLLDTLGVKKPSYYYLLGEVCNEQPILTQLYFRGAELPESEALKDYQLLTYDLVGGEDYYDKS